MSTISDFLPSIANNSFQSSSSTVITTAHDKRDRQLNYNKTLVSSVHHIECRCLYRVLMKIEMPFRGVAMKTLRHRFIKLLYENACRCEPEYTELILFVKQHLGLYISLSDTRQLVLYAALFGVTENFTSPTSEDILHVIKSCPLAVPPFINFKKWSRDVKRMENNPLSADVTKGYFAHTNLSGNSECVSIMSLREDFKEFDDQGSSCTSSDSEEDDYRFEGEEDDDDDGDGDGDKRSRLADNKSISPTFALTGRRDMKSMMVNKTKSIMLLSRLFENKEESNDSTNKDRKKGVLNLYERSDNHELNKMILALSRGKKEYVEPEKEGGALISSELAYRFSKVFTEEQDRPFISRCDSIKESDDDDDDDDLDVGDDDISDLEDQHVQVTHEERKEIEKRERELLEKRKKNIAKLSQGVSLRPSLAKINMIKKLKQQREMVTVSRSRREESRKPSVDKEKEAI